MCTLNGTVRTFERENGLSAVNAHHAHLMRNRFTSFAQYIDNVWSQCRQNFENAVRFGPIESKPLHELT